MNTGTTRTNRREAGGRDRAEGVVWLIEGFSLVFRQHEFAGKSNCV